MQMAIALVALFLTVITGGISAVWILSNKIAANTLTVTGHVVETRAELNHKISNLDRSLAVLQTSETARDEKIGRMWDWWMQALTEGWTNHMRHENKRPSGTHDIRGNQQ